MSAGTLAAYDVRWVDGVLESKMSSYHWADEPAGIATYVGDRVEFQNTFGAWQPQVYESMSTYDVRAQRIEEDVRVVALGAAGAGAAAASEL